MIRTKNLVNRASIDRKNKEKEREISLQRTPFATKIIRKLKRNIRHAIFGVVSPKIPQIPPTSEKANSERLDYLDCAFCRGFDSAQSDRTLLQIVHDVAATTGISVIHLPSPNEWRLGVAASLEASFWQAVEAQVRAAGYTSTWSEEAAQSNVYEFNHVDFTEKVCFLRVTPKPHCNIGQPYLKRRGVRLEMLHIAGDAIVVPSSGFGPRSMPLSEMRLVTADSIMENQQNDWPFPIDLVYTWVDSSDEVWQQKFDSVASDFQRQAHVKAATNSGRWHSREELRYSLRSVAMYAPWVRKIFIVTNGQVPHWLLQSERVTIVSHEDLYPEVSVLPTFNSNHIESVLHNIPDLAEHFLYLNDDFFFTAPSLPKDFFSIGGIGHVFLSPRHLDAHPVQDADRASVASHKTARALLQKRFGISCHRKFKHAPYVMRKSVWQKIDHDFEADLSRTRANRFRTQTDINGQFLYAHYALLSGNAVHRKTRYAYVDVSDASFTKSLQKSLSPTIKFLCINDADSTEVTTKDSVVKSFLRHRFPIKPTWENDKTAPIDSNESQPYSSCTH